MATSPSRDAFIRRADAEGFTATPAGTSRTVITSWEALDALLDQLDALRRRSQGFQIGNGNTQHNIF